MGKKISDEIRRRVLELNETKISRKEIKEILLKEGHEISESSIGRIIRGETSLNTSINNDETNFASFENMFVNIQKQPKYDDDDFEEENEEEKIQKENQEAMNLVKQVAQEEIEKLAPIVQNFNQELERNNKEMDELIEKTKVKPKAIKNIQSRKPVESLFTTNLQPQEQKIRRDIIINIRNLVDMFYDYSETKAIIEDICGTDIGEFKHSLYGMSLEQLNNIHEEIQIGLNQSQDYPTFMKMFTMTVCTAEFIANLMLGLQITGLMDDFRNEISEFDLRMMAAELSVSRWIKPHHKFLLVTLVVIMKRIVQSDLMNGHVTLKTKLMGAILTISSLLKRR